ncbi:antirepressor [Pasteurellaceae bacterium RH1A]|nr:antirepressor [Pasteurellaceae bacterium RH1A]
MMNEIKLFESQQVRSVWDEEREEWFFSVVDIVQVLTGSDNPRRYWSDLKRKMKKEGVEDQLYEKIVQLKLPSSDGKSYKTDVADTQTVFRVIQSIPSPKAEPFKLWLAEVGKERLDEMQDPELSIDRALAQYLKLGYSESWINQRLKSIEIRKELTDEWQKRGVQGKEFALLTDLLTKTWSGKSTKEYKVLKGLKKENLRDNMTNTELILNMLAEASTKDISQALEPETLAENMQVAQQGGDVAKTAREALEARTGKKVVTSANATTAMLGQSKGLKKA